MTTILGGAFGLMVAIDDAGERLAAAQAADEAFDRAFRVWREDARFAREFAIEDGGAAMRLRRATSNSAASRGTHATEVLFRIDPATRELVREEFAGSPASRRDVLARDAGSLAFEPVGVGATMRLELVRDDGRFEWKRAESATAAPLIPLAKGEGR